MSKTEKEEFDKKVDEIWEKARQYNPHRKSSKKSPTNVKVDEHDTMFERWYDGSDIIIRGVNVPEDD